MIILVQLISFDKDVREPPVNWNSGSNNYFWRKERFYNSRYHVCVCRPRGKDDLTDCKLSANWLEHFDVVNAKDKQNTKQKMLKYVYYPKCTKPAVSATAFFDGNKKLKDVIAGMQPKDFDLDYDEYLLFGFAPWDAEMFPSTEDTTRAVYIAVNFEWSMKVYFSMFKRDSVTS